MHYHEYLCTALSRLIAMQWPEWMQPYVDSVVVWVNGMLENVDLDYIEYLLWLFLPIIIAFLLPIFLLFFIYGCVIFLHVYGLRHRIREAYASSMWDGARTSIASFWDGVGYLWHGYEVSGLENVPETGPALFVAYHGTLPIDIYYLIAKVMLFRNRTLHVVGDKFVFKIPGWGKICKVFCITPGTVEDCIENLKAGNLLIIAPGGVREALFSNPVNYQVMWAKRLGFAKVVLGANVPVIPVFTENCRDAFRTPRWGRRIFRRFYEKTRMPICPIYGGFPVKMITHLGAPLTFPLDTPAEDVKTTIREKVQELIQDHQRMPGSIIRGCWQRFQTSKKPQDSARSDGRSTAENAEPLSSDRDFPEALSSATTATLGGPSPVTVHHIHRSGDEDHEEDVFSDGPLGGADEEEDEENRDPAAQPLMRGLSLQRRASQNSATRRSVNTVE